MWNVPLARLVVQTPIIVEKLHRRVAAFGKLPRRSVGSTFRPTVTVGPAEPGTAQTRLTATTINVQHVLDLLMDNIFVFLFAAYVPISCGLPLAP
jgi:hypothetical protein